jgi:hypothetical protein
MKRKRLAPSTTKKSSRPMTLPQLEKHVGLLLMLLEHNLAKVFRQKRSR